MSGGGGGGINDGNWRIGGESPSGEDKCAITERTILNSPNAAVIANLAVGDILAVTLVPGQRSRLEAIAGNGQTAGAVTSRRMVDIIECIKNGFIYEAQFISINAGRVEIEIRLA